MKVLKRVVIITFWVTLCVLLFFVIVAGMNKWAEDAMKSGTADAFTPSPTPVPDRPAVATEIVFVTNIDGTLKACYISEINSRECKWRLTVVPNDSRMELSSSLYKTLSRENVTVPQIATLSELYRAFSKETASQNCFLALAELINFTPDSLLTVSSAEFARIVRDEPESYSFDGFLAEDLENEIKAAGGLLHFIEDYFAGKQTTLALRDRLFYLETFESLTNLRISCRLIPGERHNNGYEVKTDANDFFK